MKIFVWKRVYKVSDNYHDEGGLLVVAENEERAKELIGAEQNVIVTDEEWAEVITYELMDVEKERIITFPDAGCC